MDSIFFLIIGIAFIAELIDSSAGMGYGTLLSPLLLLMGYSPFTAVPAILITQALGGLIATCFHHKYRNAVFHMRSDDAKIVFLITVMGIVAIFFSGIVVVGIPSIYVKAYISILVLLMGIFIFIGKTFKFSWKKMIGISLLSSFNKCISGGGFGPVVTGGQVISGKECKSSIGVTTFAEVPICLLSFLMYLFLSFTKGSVMLDWGLIIALGIGSLVAAPCGPYLTKKIPPHVIQKMLAILLCIVGIWGIVRLWPFLFERL